MPARPPINLQDYLVLESSDLAHTNAEGAIEVQPGEEAVLVEYEPQESEHDILLHALGATGVVGDLQYRLTYGQNVSAQTESPPGGYTAPFSFTQELGAPLTSTELVQYTAINNTGQVQELVGVMHVEIDRTPGPPRSGSANAQGGR